ncbi:WhiB family transcriptional regulator [Amycolatopsis arida]|uniref:WhiB family transcriptional regulator n=1 Tax=Amycolatopsis arida TaxID=587909 RepID=UPI0010EBB922|nr:WhiB family transcriptional regulator [Amycolatopsis arida]TDX84957.1 WhiB family redox-sensing transcriptional regulator [Amycolatopsis arida]
MTWRDKAACRDTDPELFFAFADTADERTAKAICWGHCPVRESCLEEALAAGIDAGIWGGLTEDERRGLRRRRTEAAA